MSDLLRIAAGAGLQDGFNPCILMTCAVFIVHGIWAPQRPLHLGFLRSLFVLVYVLGTLCFNYGPLEAFLFKKSFVLTVKIIYFLLGAGSFVLGVLFLKDWFSLRFKHQADLAVKKTPSINVIVAYFITIILSLGLSVLATLWPVNYYMTLLGTGWLVNGQWQSVVLLLVTYTIVSMWPLWFLWAFLSIKNLRPALLKIVCAAVFFAASSSIILIFK